MIIGIDFDNTIVCYDALFHQLAVERQLIPPGLPATKHAVRQHLRRRGLESIWTELQGTAYGTRILDARPFAGAREFLGVCRRHGATVHLISHKTRQPFAGPACDLHRAAWGWLEHHGFIAPADGLLRANVWFEETKEEKLARIGDCACDYFIDDLPEFLAETAFPQNTRRVLFDPNRTHTPAPGTLLLGEWRSAPALLLRH